jgi:hypothetical protein
MFRTNKKGELFACELAVRQYLEQALVIYYGTPVCFDSFDWTVLESRDRHYETRVKAKFSTGWGREQKLDAVIGVGKLLKRWEIIWNKVDIKVNENDGPWQYLSAVVMHEGAGAAYVLPVRVWAIGEDGLSDEPDGMWRIGCHLGDRRLEPIHPDLLRPVAV